MRYLPAAVNSLMVETTQTACIYTNVFICPNFWFSYAFRLDEGSMGRKPIVVTTWKIGGVNLETFPRGSDSTGKRIFSVSPHQRCSRWKRECRSFCIDLVSKHRYLGWSYIYGF
ncbi:hypothetical protein H1C71_026614 [Ictidomys tridecemlineatus]|nr:hypothetical protein H1C71_026614 [Ictidomys tridecemlineatus]